MCESLIPLLHPGGRIINVSSSVGQLNPAVTNAPGCPLAVSTQGVEGDASEIEHIPVVACVGVDVEVCLESERLEGPEIGSLCELV